MRESIGYTTRTDTLVRQIPQGIRLDDTPILLSVSDQGPMNVPALDMLTYHAKLCIQCQWDGHRRVWHFGRKNFNIARVFCVSNAR